MHKRSSRCPPPFTWWCFSNVGDGKMKILQVGALTGTTGLMDAGYTNIPQLKMLNFCQFQAGRPICSALV